MLPNECGSHGGGSPGVSVAELERRIKALERENADLREQKAILKKAVAMVSELPRGGMA